MMLKSFKTKTTKPNHPQLTPQKDTLWIQEAYIYIFLLIKIPNMTSENFILFIYAKSELKTSIFSYTAV